MFKEYRLNKKLTQEKLAELLNISTRQLQRIENEECIPSLKLIKKFIFVLEITDKDIITYMKAPTKEKVLTTN